MLAEITPETHRLVFAILLVVGITNLPAMFERETWWGKLLWGIPPATCLLCAVWYWWTWP